MSDHVSIHKFKRAKAAIALLPADDRMTYRGVPMKEFTKEQILRVLLWQIEVNRKTRQHSMDESKVFRHWP